MDKKILEDIIWSSLWKASSIEDTPSLELARWSVYEVDSELWPGSTCHFVGYNLTEREGRVSSAIVEFDKEKMVGKTKSGRVYQLCGPPGHDPDADWVWCFFIDRNKLTETVEITDQYWEE
jgi:hypothetical protein